ncbi:XRE family transcriptional regulator [Psychrobacillus sp. NPDC093180]|uniref:XRE family transcriptional regulator n=1 Tax=Psychrobacillus sp. NPDC093180 TaxID=3364489 RepID=UPI003800334E
MVVKNAVNVGDAVSRLMETEELTGDQLAIDLNISRQLGNHMKNDRRKMQQDIAKESIQTYDNPEYIHDVLYEFSEGYTSPVFRGHSIEQHRLSIGSYTIQELQEAIGKMKEVSLAKPPSIISKEELQEIKSLMEELLDGKVFIDNMLIQLQKDYGISIKDCIGGLMPRWVAKGWMALTNKKAD